MRAIRLRTQFGSPVYMSSWTQRVGIYDIMNTDVFTSHERVYHRQGQGWPMWHLSQCHGEYHEISFLWLDSITQERKLDWKACLVKVGLAVTFGIRSGFPGNRVHLMSGSRQQTQTYPWQQHKGSPQQRVFHFVLWTQISGLFLKKKSECWKGY